MFIRSSHIFLVLTVTLIAVTLSWSHRPSPARHISEIIIQYNLIDFNFEQRVHAIAESYAKDTRYAGLVRVNKSLKNGYINIYLFKFSSLLPVFLESNCTAFPEDAAIFCDSVLFDSIPNWDILGSINILEYWIVGHEVAHLLFGTLNKKINYVNFNDCRVALSASEFFEKCIDISSVEIQADRYAINGLPIKNEEEWARASPSIVDAILYYAVNGASGDHDSIEISNSNPSHPEMSIRLMSLYRELKVVFENFRADFFFGERLSDLSIYINPKLSSTFNGLFYGGFYVNDEKGYNSSFEVLNRSIEFFVDRDFVSYKKILGDGCNNMSFEKESEDYIRYLYCKIAFDNEGKSPSFVPLSECDLGPDSIDDLCYTILILTYELCFNSGKSMDVCQDKETLIDRIERLQGRQTRYNYFVMRWQAIAELNYFFNEKGGEGVMEWVANANNYFFNSQDSSMAVELSRLLYEKSLASKDKDQIIRSLIMLRETYGYSENLNYAWITGEELVKKADQLFEDNHPLQASARQDLGRIMTKYGMVFSSFSTYFGRLQFLEHTDLTFIGDFPHGSTDGPELLVEAYQRYISLIAEEVNVEVRSALLERAIISLNDAIFGFNIRGRCDISEGYSSNILNIVGYPESIETGSFSAARVLIPVLENVAVTEVCISNGDLELALRLQEMVFKMRNESDFNNIFEYVETLRILAYINYALENTDEARELIENYIDLYKKYVGRGVDINFSFLVQGEAVQLRELLGDDSNN